MSKRISYEIPGFAHDNPIPGVARIGNLVVTSAISGKGADGKFPAGIEAQCAQMFAHVRSALAAVGAGPEHIIKLTVWLKDRANRPVVNKFWMELFPDQHSRPARHTFAAPDLAGDMLCQCEIMAVLGD